MRVHCFTGLLYYRINLTAKHLLTWRRINAQMQRQCTNKWKTVTEHMRSSNGVRKISFEKINSIFFARQFIYYFFFSLSVNCFRSRNSFRNQWNTVRQQICFWFFFLHFFPFLNVYCTMRLTHMPPNNTLIVSTQLSKYI